MEYTQKTKSHALQPQFSDISERVIRSLDSKVPKLARQPWEPMMLGTPYMIRAKHQMLITKSNYNAIIHKSIVDLVHTFTHRMLTRSF